MKITAYSSWNAANLKFQSSLIEIFFLISLQLNSSQPASLKRISQGDEFAALSAVSPRLRSRNGRRATSTRCVPGRARTALPYYSQVLWSKHEDMFADWLMFLWVSKSTSSIVSWPCWVVCPDISPAHRLCSLTWLCQWSAVIQWSSAMILIGLACR